MIDHTNVPKGFSLFASGSLEVVRETAKAVRICLAGGSTATHSQPCTWVPKSQIRWAYYDVFGAPRPTLLVRTWKVRDMPYAMQQEAI